MTATPSDGRGRAPGLRDRGALSVLAFGRGPDADRALWARLVRQARCAESGLDADRWFPVSANADSAVGEAADAIAVCRSCQVRSLCLALSLLHRENGDASVGGWRVPTTFTVLAAPDRVTFAAAPTPPSVSER